MKGVKKRLADLHTELDDLKNKVTDLVSDLQAEWDDRSEKWQESERGDQRQCDIDELANVAEEIDSAMATLSEVDL